MLPLQWMRKLVQELSKRQAPLRRLSSGSGSAATAERCSAHSRRASANADMSWMALYPPLLVHLHSN